MTDKTEKRKMKPKTEIELPGLTSMPDREMWTYYWENPAGKIQPAYFYFFNNRVEAEPAYVDLTKIITTDSDANVARILDYQRTLLIQKH